MTLSKKPYKGCRDFIPKDMRIREFLFNNMHSSAKKFAYEPYDGPLLEEVELYKAKSGEELINDQIYSFEDRGGRQVAIRPEMTPTLARMVAGVHREVPKPLRWYSIPNLMRYEKPQRGRVREHWQYNVDIFGAPKNLGEVEILNLIIDFLTGFGADKSMFSILINDRSIVDSLFCQVLGLDEEKSYKLYKVIDKAKKVSAEKLDKMIIETIEDTKKIDAFKEYLSCSTFEDILAYIQKHQLQEQTQDFAQFIQMVKELSMADYIQYDPTIVRGLDYYTGIVFEIFDKHPENNRAIAGGGAYANLLQIFNEPALSGVGFGLGDVTLKDFLATHNLLPDFTHAQNDLYVFYTQKEQQLKSLNWSNDLRAHNLNIELHLGEIKFNKIFKLAQNKGYEHIAIIEERDGKVTAQLKNLSDKSSEVFELTDIQSIKKYLKKG
ncbi:MAG: histidine--tRNA ligase [Halobacteriovoraceae bacterium]|jgi:histidyl-tRNA synthetase|nr:histidine--tRNA ligase [Halobacteriovoraceae bacterium]